MKLCEPSLTAVQGVSGPAPCVHPADVQLHAAGPADVAGVQRRHPLQQHLPLPLPQDADREQHRAQGDGSEEEQEEELCASKPWDRPYLPFGIVLFRCNENKVPQL